MTDPAQWYSCDIGQKELKAYMCRNDRIGLIWFGAWLACLVASGLLAYRSLGTGWVVPAFVLYGILFAFAEPIAHECSHGTPFRTRWLNEAVHAFTALMIFREPTMHRWMHARHHSHTILVGQDPEIQVPRPMSIWIVIAELSRLRSFYNFSRALPRHAFGRISAEAREWVPRSEHRKLILGSRLFLVVYGAIVAAAIALGSWLPIVFFFLPRLLGGWLHVLLAMTQHAGLAENVHDHRRNTRDVYMNPLFRFLYWNMNYHIEHHLYPMVPYHALPRLHERLRDQLPRPYHGLREAYGEMIATFIRQRRDPSYFVDPAVPPAAEHRAA